MKALDQARTAPGSACSNRTDTDLADTSDPGAATVAIGGLSIGPAVRRAAVELAEADPLGGTAIPQSVLGALRRNRGAGQPLPSDLSVSAGEALGRDLSPVRVHTDPEAANLARSVQAVAFTHGHDIYFSAGSYRPAEPEGQRLIAHELGHVGQSESAGAGGVIGRADDPAEAAADRAATGVLAALRRQAARGAIAPGHGYAGYDHAGQAGYQAYEHSGHGHAGHDRTGRGAGVLRQTAQGAGIRRMTVNQDGTYALFSGFRDTSDRAGFAAWVKELQDAGKTKVLQNLMTALHRSMLSLADHEAIGLSLVQRALDKLAPAVEAPAEGEKPGLQNMPRADWWKLFIEGDKHDADKPGDQNAMRFDTEQSPGYYAAMSRAFETYVANSDGHELTFADYDAMHLAVTRDTLSKRKDNTYKAVPHKLSAQDIQYPMTKGEFPNPEALHELRAQGVLGLDAKKKTDLVAGIDVNEELAGKVAEFGDGVTTAHEDGEFLSTAELGGMMLLTLRQIYQGQGPITDFSSTLQVVNITSDKTMQLLVNTNRDASAANAEVSALFKTYYAELKKVPDGEGTDRVKRRNKLVQVARLVRALHVGHYFHDANGRLNTMVLLNRLLVDCGFTPVLMDRTDIFGGAFSEMELVAAIELGFRKFAREVNLAPPEFEELVDDQLGVALLNLPAEDQPRLLSTAPLSTAPVSKAPVSTAMASV